MTRPNNKRTKRVTGWMISKNGGDVAYTVFKTKKQAAKMVEEWDFAGSVLIPCTISFSLPTTRKRGV